LRGGDPRTIASFLIRSLRWPLYCDHSVTSADVRLVGVEIFKDFQDKYKVSGTAASAVTGDNP
jgi:hypothetical protein